MSNPDSFINEVTEEVRRDRLYGFFRKYWWVWTLILVGTVGGTIANEIIKARKTEAAIAFGDALTTASEAGDIEALDALIAQGGEAAVLARLQKAAVYADQGDRETAVSVLNMIALDSGQPAIYRDLALLKVIILDMGSMRETDLLAAFDRLGAPNAPFRLLTLEQKAFWHVSRGETENAKALLQAIIEDQGSTQDLRNRAQELMIALEAS